MHLLLPVTLRLFTLCLNQHCAYIVYHVYLYSDLFFYIVLFAFIAELTGSLSNTFLCIVKPCVNLHMTKLN